MDKNTHSVNPDDFNSLGELFLKACDRYANKPMLCHMGHQVSYRQLKDYVQRFATYLQSLGLKKDDRIALMMPNLLQYPVCLYGALMAGMVVVNINPLFTTKELDAQLQDAEPKAIVIFEPFAKTLQDATFNVEHKIITRFGDLFAPFKGALINFVVKYVKRMGEAYELKDAVFFKSCLTNNNPRRVDVVGDDLAFLQYTGGTTGTPKGAMLTHRNLIANVLQVSSWLEPLFTPGKEVVIAALPLYHIFALMVNGLLCTNLGAMNILITNPRDLKTFVKEIKRFRFTALIGVNTLFNGLMRFPAFRKLDFSALKLSLGGGMQVQQAVAEQWRELTGHPLLEGYGLTEASPVVAVNPPLQTEYDGSIGLPMPLTEVKIMLEDGNEAKTNEPGELWVKGPQVMKGYWQKPVATKEVLSDGWLKTGDIARQDEQGRLFIVDRKKDLIIVSGFNVYPNEIEDVLVKMPGVLEAAIVGVSVEGKGERVKAFIIKDDENLTEEKVIDYCRKSLTAYKVPKLIEFVSDLPKSNVGKVLRKELRS